PFFAWQIELTTRCPLLCSMCVKTAAGGWDRRDITFENFEKIVPYLSRVENVVLEGWGDPLMYPRIVDVVRRVRGQGAKPGFVCCGNGMSDEKMKAFIDGGLDFIGFSFSGGTAAVHNAIRVHSDFDKLRNTVGRFTGMIRAAGAGNPRVHIVYLMLKDNIHEIPRVLDIAHETGVERVNLINIIQVSNEAQDSQRVYTCGGGNPYREIIGEAREKARRLKIGLNVPFIEADEVDVCNENPLRNVYISSEGEVSPCVFLNPPVDSPLRRFYCGKEHSVEKVSFGNIFDRPFDDIWDSPSYRSFRERFAARKLKMREIFAALEEKRLVRDDRLPDPPEPCRSCHEMLGF
ncbi:MAG TPA: radical SAM protein, partial [Spirochaetes bacterium]|nr:radical SAM protein [Spirochaetota bacterium]